MPRWESLFEDLAAQAAALDVAERAAEVEERARGEMGELALVDRLRASVGQDAHLLLTGELPVPGRITHVGPDWVLVRDGAGGETFAPLAHVTVARGLARDSAVPGSAGVVASRLGLRAALRAIARDRSPVRVQLAAGAPVEGTVDRVGADFVELAVHPRDEARRPSAVRGFATIALSAVVALRREP